MFGRRRCASQPATRRSPREGAAITPPSWPAEMLARPIAPRPAFRSASRGLTKVTKKPAQGLLAAACRPKDPTRILLPL